MGKDGLILTKNNKNIDSNNKVKIVSNINSTNNTITWKKAKSKKLSKFKKIYDNKENQSTKNKSVTEKKDNNEN